MLVAAVVVEEVILQAALELEAQAVVAQAAVPIPALIRPKKCRRVSRRARDSIQCSISSLNPS